MKDDFNPIFLLSLAIVIMSLITKSYLILIFIPILIVINAVGHLASRPKLFVAGQITSYELMSRADEHSSDIYKVHVLFDDGHDENMFTSLKLENNLHGILGIRGNLIVKFIEDEVNQS